MSAKFTILGLFRTNVFSNKDYDVWSKFVNSSIFLRQVIITTILWASDQKKDFLRDALGSSLIIWD